MRQVASGLVLRAPGRHNQIRREPPKKIRGFYPPKLFNAKATQGLWEEIEASLLILGRTKACEIFRVDNPHTKPFAVSGNGSSGSKDGAIPDAFFFSEAFTRPKIMKTSRRLGSSKGTRISRGGTRNTKSSSTSPS